MLSKKSAVCRRCATIESGELASRINVAPTALILNQSCLERCPKSFFDSIDPERPLAGPKIPHCSAPLSSPIRYAIRRSWPESSRCNSAGYAFLLAAPGMRPDNRELLAGRSVVVRREVGALLLRRRPSSRKPARPLPRWPPGKLPDPFASPPRKLAAPSGVPASRRPFGFGRRSENSPPRSEAGCQKRRAPAAMRPSPPGARATSSNFCHRQK
jgi:hypothetical protein